MYTLSKIKDANAIRNLVSRREIKKATIIGAGLIGLEMAEAFASQGLEVTVVEVFDQILPVPLDFEVAAYVEKHLRGKGVNLLLGQRVKGFQGDEHGWVCKVTTEGEELETGLVLLALSACPNTKLAWEAGLSIGSMGGISVNHYLQTSDPDIYAGGDLCGECQSDYSTKGAFSSGVYC